MYVKKPEFFISVFKEFMRLNLTFAFIRNVCLFFHMGLLSVEKLLFETKVCTLIVALTVLSIAYEIWPTLFC